MLRPLAAAVVSRWGRCCTTRRGKRRSRARQHYSRACGTRTRSATCGKPGGRVVVEAPIAIAKCKTYIPPHGSKRIYRLSEFLKGAGMKTALVSGPHRAVSVLLHSPEGAAGVAGGRDDVWLMLGVHPQQVSRRRWGRVDI